MLFHRRQHAQITLDTSCVVITDVVLNHLNEFPLTGELSAVIAGPVKIYAQIYLQAPAE